MPFKKLSITVEEALAEAQAEHSGWRMLPELDNRLEAQGSGMDVARLRQLQGEVAQLPFPADPAEHAVWYREINDRLEALGAFISTAVPLRSVFLPGSNKYFDNSLLFDTGENTQPFPVDLKNLCVIADDFPPTALPFLRQCALRACERDRRSGSHWGNVFLDWGSLVLGMYAVLTGADAVSDLLDEWRKLLPVASLADSDPHPCLYRHIAIFLVLIAPPSRYPELAGILRAQFDAIGKQEKEGYWDSLGQCTLGAIAYALAIFDPKSAPVIRARSSEYGTFWRYVQWGLDGITPSNFVDMLLYAGAIDPVRPVELQRALSSCDPWIWNLCLGQDRLMDEFHRYVTELSLDAFLVDSLCAFALAMATLSARMVRPQIDLAHVHLHIHSHKKDRSQRIRFFHAGSMFEFILPYSQSADACFNRFLEYIGHPQRIFSIDDGCPFREEDYIFVAFICADKTRFPEIIRQLNHGDDLDTKARLVPPSTKDWILRDLCEMCISRHVNDSLRNDFEYLGDYIAEYYMEEPHEPLSPDTQELIVEALFCKVLYLQQLDRKTEAQKIHGFITRHFKKHPAFPEGIGKAWDRRGSILLLEAKSVWDDAPTAKKLLQQAQIALRKAHEKRPGSGFVLGNLAYVLWLLGETENAEAILRRAFSIESGKRLCHCQLTYSDFNPIPPDAGFKELLQRVLQKTGAFP